MTDVARIAERALDSVRAAPTAESMRAAVWELRPFVERGALQATIWTSLVAVAKHAGGNETLVREVLDAELAKPPRRNGQGALSYEELERAAIQGIPATAPAPTSNGHEARPPVARSMPTTPAKIIERWRDDGALVRVPTGIEPLDRMCRGGLPIPWRVIIVGAPSAGKTAVGTVIADELARNAAEWGLCVGVHAVDEEDEDLTVRLLQIAGFSVAQAELRDPQVLRDMGTALAPLRIRFYDSSHTIESAAADLANWANAERRNALLMIDSLQAATSGLAEATASPRESVEANVEAMKVAVRTHRMLVVATCEANRASYRSDDAADTTNDLAAGAESRAIEFGAQTQLMLRTPKDHPDIIHVRVAKNRRADRGEFWLRLDRDRHTVSECPDPTADPSVAAERETRQREVIRGTVERDARELAKLIGRSPGLGELDLRAAIREAGHRWGRDRLNAARRRLASGAGGVRLVDRGPHPRDRRWFVEPDEADRGGSDA